MSCGALYWRQGLNLPEPNNLSTWYKHEGIRQHLKKQGVVTRNMLPAELYLHKRQRHTALLRTYIACL